MQPFYERLRDALYASQLTPDEMRGLHQKWWAFDVVERFSWASEYDSLPLPLWRSAVSRAFIETHGHPEDCVMLLDFIDEHRDAVAYECIRLGQRLRNFPSSALTYGDLMAIIRQSPVDSAISRAVDPEQSAWGLTEQLLALVADYAANQLWMGTEDAQKGRNRPKPIPRPGVVDDDENTEVKKFGSDPVPIAELDEFLGWAKAKVEQRMPARSRDPVTGRFVKRT